MYRRVLYAFLPVGVAALLVLLLTSGVGVAAPAAGGPTLLKLGSQADAAPASVSFRRAISIPFGIAITQELNSLGNQVLVTGHGNCWAEGQMFDLRVRIAQSSTHAFAEGHTIDNCSGDQQQWDAQARVDQRVRLEEGPARACAEATEWGTHGVVDEHAWCKDIMLEKTNGAYQP